MKDTEKRAADNLSMAEGIKLGCLAIEECYNGLGREEHDFLDAASEYVAINSDNKPNKLEAWEMLKKLRELTEKQSAKEAVLSVVGSGQYPSNIASFRTDNFSAIELAYKYIGSVEPLATNKKQEQISQETPVVDPAPTTQPTEKMVQPFTVGAGTTPVQTASAEEIQIEQAVSKVVEKATSPDIIKLVAKPVMDILNTIEQDPSALVNLMNGVSILLATPAPTTATQSGPTVTVQTCGCGNQH